MVTKVINIKVQDGDLNQLENDLKQVDKQFKKVDQSADKASKSVDDVASNGGAIAILDSLTGGLATRLRDAYEASKLFNFSLKATRTALIATGIGAFVVALGAVVAYWDDIVGFITGANSELEETLDLQTELADESQRQLDLLDKQDNILKLQGKSEKEIRDIKRQQLKEVIAQREEELKLAKERLLSLQQLQKAGGSSLQQITRVFQSSIIALGTALDKVSGFLGLDTDFAGTATSGTSSLIESVFGTQDDIDNAPTFTKAVGLLWQTLPLSEFASDMDQIEAIKEFGIDEDFDWWNSSDPYLRSQYPEELYDSKNIQELQLREQNIRQNLNAKQEIDKLHPFKKFLVWGTSLAQDPLILFNPYKKVEWGGNIMRNLGKNFLSSGTRTAGLVAPWEVARVNMDPTADPEKELPLVLGGSFLLGGALSPIFAKLKANAFIKLFLL